MGVGVVLRFPALGATEYDTLMLDLDLCGDDPKWPDGMIDYFAGPGSDGWWIVGAWVSQDHFEDFWQHRFKPAFDAIGGLPDPEVAGFVLHHLSPVE